MNIKEPNCAGSFYLGEELSLKNCIDSFMKEAISYEGDRPAGIIVPHAGHIYSGPIAATGYKAIEKYRDSFKRVAIFSPTHYYNFKGVASCSYEAFSTPLGAVHCDVDKVKLVEKLGKALIINEVFDKEHALEVHLPFLQQVLGEFQLLPFIVGDSSSQEVIAVLDEIYDDETVIVISSDLSHFLGYEEAKVADRKTADMILNCDGRIQGEDACGKYPLNGFLSWVKSRSLQIKELDLRNSGDTAGDKSRVVGYGSFVVS